MVFYFLRHGETDWNAIKRIQGRTDIPLNARGEAQARAAAGLLKSLAIDKIIASPLKRAAATAAIVQEYVAVPLHHDEHLIEQHYGSFEGRLRHEIADELGIDAEAVWQSLPADAEHPSQFAERIMGRVLHHVQSAPNQTLLFVGHGGVMGALTGQLGISTNHHFANAIPYRYSHDGERWHMEALRPEITCLEP